MAWEQKLMRTVRLRNDQVPGTLASLLAAMAESGASVGGIKLLTETPSSVVRDISIYAEDGAHLERILSVMRANPGTNIIAVRDEVLELHRHGKIAMRSRAPVDSLGALRKVYTPGVAEVCRKIADDPTQARLYTGISQTVAIVTDGTAVLGLGDIGPVAGMPVMEGKAMLLDSLVGLSGIPVLVNTKDPDEIVDTIVNIAPSFGAIQLEDVSAPRCFQIEEQLMHRLDIPVMHDDQHGTAVVSTAALRVACNATGMDLDRARVGQVGLGAAGLAIAKMLMRLTANPVYGVDLSEELLQRLEQEGGVRSSLEAIMADSDIVIATTGVAGLIKPEMVRQGQIILALSNPNPEIEPEAAEAAGAAFAADGKSVNNVLGFPGIFRGAMEANASRITQEMLLAAAETIAELTPAGELVPNPLDKAVHRAVARAVAQKAIEQGISRGEYMPYLGD